MSTMSAIIARAGMPTDHPDSFADVTVDVPEVRPRDLLVRVQAVSVNPVDIKRRATGQDSSILGFDAAGVVEKVGSEVAEFVVGEEVWYAGDITRPGTNAQYHAVDERLVARKPVTLSFAEAAALPLTTITAWETLFERFALRGDSTGDLLILGAAGGVGSVMIQLAALRTGMRIIATASRPESARWCRELGADVVIDHHDLHAQALRVARNGVDYIFSPHSRGNVETFAEIIRPFGHIAAIDEPEGLDLLALKAKSVAWHWELMFTRSMFGYDMIAQQRLLTDAAAMVDRGELRTTMTTTIDTFTADDLRRAHRLVETGDMVGKVVIHR